MSTAKQRRRAQKRARQRPDLHPEAILVACDNCGTVQTNRSQVAYLKPIEPCGNCGNLEGHYVQEVT